MNETLLDTDMLSEILKGKNARVVEAGERYLARYGNLTFSVITFYEVYRGLRSKRAARALSRFLAIVDESEILPISIPVLKRAGDLWVDALQGGFPRNDADLIIAASALKAGLTLATGNTAHFDWIDGLSLVDWRT